MMVKRKIRRRSLNGSTTLSLTTISAAMGFLLFVGGGGLFYAANLENNDSFCVSCHTRPETAYYQRTQDAAATDLASAHSAKGVKCIECHSGAGPIGRLQGMSVGAGDLAAYLSGRYHNPAVATVPVGDGNCLKCHADVTARRDFDNHFHVFLAQWQALAPGNAATCVDCHESHVTGGLSNIAFLQEAPTVAVCDRCHAIAGEGG